MLFGKGRVGELQSLCHFLHEIVAHKLCDLSIHPSFLVKQMPLLICPLLTTFVLISNYPEIQLVQL